MTIQALGMGKINQLLEEKLLQSEKIDLEALYLEFESKAKEYKLTDWQIERYKSVFTVFKEAVRKKDADVEKYKNLSSAEIVKEIVGMSARVKWKWKCILLFIFLSFLIMMISQGCFPINPCWIDSRRSCRGK